MHTLKTIPAGRVSVVIRSDGHVYIAEKEHRKNYFSGGVDVSNFDTKPKLVATSAVGCHGLAEALREAETFLRERKAESE